MITFLGHPMNFVLCIYKDHTLRKGPDSSPDRLGLQGAKEVKKPPAVSPRSASALGSLVSPGAPGGPTGQEPAIGAGWRYCFQAAPGGRSVSSERWAGVLSLQWFSASPSKTKKGNFTSWLRESFLFRGWPWMCSESIWAPRSEHTGV